MEILFKEKNCAEIYVNDDEMTHVAKITGCEKELMERNINQNFLTKISGYFLNLIIQKCIEDKNHLYAKNFVENPTMVDMNYDATKHRYHIRLMQDIEQIKRSQQEMLEEIGQSNDGKPIETSPMNVPLKDRVTLEGNTLEDCFDHFKNEVIPSVIENLIDMGETNLEDDELPAAMVVHTPNCLMNFCSAMTSKELDREMQKMVKYFAEEYKKEVSRHKNFYEMKCLDHIMEIMPYFKAADVIKRKNNYYLISNEEPMIIYEYGKKVNKFIYSDESLLCKIKDGNFAKKEGG